MKWIYQDHWWNRLRSSVQVITSNCKSLGVRKVDHEEQVRQHPWWITVSRTHSPGRYSRSCKHDAQRKRKYANNIAYKLHAFSAGSTNEQTMRRHLNTHLYFMPAQTCWARWSSVRLGAGQSNAELPCLVGINTKHIYLILFAQSSTVSIRRLDRIPGSYGLLKGG